MSMRPITLLASIYHLYALVTCVYSIPTEPVVNCSCLLTEDPENNSSMDYGPKPLHCERNSQQPRLTTQSVPCQRYKNLVRIGPVPGDLGFRNHVTIAPWGFSDLLTEGLTTTLQLDLHLENTEVNALSLGGLETIREFLGRHSVVQWDGCSFAHMRQLERVLLSCKSAYHGFLTFGPGIRVVRFVDCENLALQFYCITCQQDPAFSVIRIGPGPRLARYMVKFSHFNLRFHANASSMAEDEEHLSVGNCAPSFCSDEVLCRNNPYLQEVLNSLGRSDKEVDIAIPEVPIVSSDSTVLKNVTVTTSEVVPEDPIKLATHGIDGQVVISRNRTVLSRAQHILIIGSVLSVIGLLLITLCVVVGMLRRGSARGEQKQARLPRRNRMNPIRVLPGTSLINGGKTEEARLEMLDKALADHDVQRDTLSNTAHNNSLSPRPNDPMPQDG